MYFYCISLNWCKNEVIALHANFRILPAVNYKRMKYIFLSKVIISLCYKSIYSAKR